MTGTLLIVCNVPVRKVGVIDVDVLVARRCKWTKKLVLVLFLLSFVRLLTCA